MAAGVSTAVWEIADIVKLIEVAEIERKANAFGPMSGDFRKFIRKNACFCAILGEYDVSV